MSRFWRIVPVALLVAALLMVLTVGTSANERLQLLLEEISEVETEIRENNLEIVQVRRAISDISITIDVLEDLFSIQEAEYREVKAVQDGFISLMRQWEREIWKLNEEVAKLLSPYELAEAWSTYRDSGETREAFAEFYRTVRGREPDSATLADYATHALMLRREIDIKVTIPLGQALVLIGQQIVAFQELAFSGSGLMPARSAYDAGRQFAGKARYLFDKISQYAPGLTDIVGADPDLLLSAVDFGVRLAGEISGFSVIDVDLASFLEYVPIAQVQGIRATTMANEAFDMANRSLYGVPDRARAYENAVEYRDMVQEILYEQMDQVSELEQPLREMERRLELLRERIDEWKSLRSDFADQIGELEAKIRWKESLLMGLRAGLRTYLRGPDSGQEYPRSVVFSIPSALRRSYGLFGWLYRRPSPPIPVRLSASPVVEGLTGIPYSLPFRVTGGYVYYTRYDVRYNMVSAAYFCNIVDEGREASYITHRFQSNSDDDDRIVPTISDPEIVGIDGRARELYGIQAGTVQATLETTGVVDIEREEVIFGHWWHIHSRTQEKLRLWPIFRETSSFVYGDIHSDLYYDITVVDVDRLTFGGIDDIEYESEVIDLFIADRGDTSHKASINTYVSAVATDGTQEWTSASRVRESSVELGYEIDSIAGVDLLQRSGYGAPFRMRPLYATDMRLLTLGVVEILEREQELHIPKQFEVYINEVKKEVRLQQETGVSRGGALQLPISEPIEFRLRVSGNADMGNYHVRWVPLWNWQFQDRFSGITRTTEFTRTWVGGTAKDPRLDQWSSGMVFSFNEAFFEDVGNILAATNENYRLPDREEIRDARLHYRQAESVPSIRGVRAEVIRKADGAIVYEADFAQPVIMAPPRIENMEFARFGDAGGMIRVMRIDLFAPNDPVLIPLGLDLEYEGFGPADKRSLRAASGQPGLSVRNIRVDGLGEIWDNHLLLGGAGIYGPMGQTVPGDHITGYAVATVTSLDAARLGIALTKDVISDSLFVTLSQLSLDVVGTWPELFYQVSTTSPVSVMANRLLWIFDNDEVQETNFRHEDGVSFSQIPVVEEAELVEVQMVNAVVDGPVLARLDGGGMRQLIDEAERIANLPPGTRFNVEVVAITMVGDRSEPGGGSYEIADASPDGTYLQGTSIVVTPHAMPGYELEYWIIYREVGGTMEFVGVRSDQKLTLEILANTFIEVMYKKI